MMIRLLCYFTFFIISSYSPFLAANWKAEREALDQVYILSPFRLFYTLEGANALSEKNQKDRNHNGIPDFIESVADKLKFAFLVYQKSFAFISPLQSHRFKHKVHIIDVHFIDIKGNGNSGDGIHQLNYQTLSGKPKSSLIITLSTRLKASNLTPEHELFHSFQYGYASFKNKWYMEGMARWSEYIFKHNTGSQKKLPLSIPELDEVLGKAYGAKYFWRRLAYLCDTNNRSYIAPTNFPLSLIKKLYPQIDFKIYGYGFMRQFLQNLSEMDKIVTEKRAFKPYLWHESQKKSMLNNKYILLVITKTIQQVGYKKDQEMQKFLTVLKSYIRYLEQTQSIDLSEYIEDLGIPYQNYYQQGEDIFSRNIWDLHYFQQQIFIGAGNSANAGPSPNAGPVPVISYHLTRQNFNQEGLIDDEKINLYRTLNGHLYIPGEDATENHQFSNFYQRTRSGEWKKFRTIPKGLHTFDIHIFKQQLFTALGVPKGAAVGISSNQGKNWRIESLGSRQRVYNLLQIDDNLYAVKQFLPYKKRNKLSPAEQKDYFSVAEYRQGIFIPRADLDRNSLFPKTYLGNRKTLHISRNIHWPHIDKSDKGSSVYIGANYFNNGFGFYIAESFTQGKLKISRIEIPQSCKPRDMLVRGDTLYLLCSKEEELEIRNSVFTLNRKQLKKASLSPKELFHFRSTTFARAFEENAGDFYFGLGYNVKSQRKWQLNEIDPQTGKFLRLKRSDIKPKTTSKGN